MMSLTGNAMTWAVKLIKMYDSFGLKLYWKDLG